MLMWYWRCAPGRWILVAEYALSAGLVCSVWYQPRLGEFYLARLALALNIDVGVTLLAPIRPRHSRSVRSLVRLCIAPPSTEPHH